MRIVALLFLTLLSSIHSIQAQSSSIAKPPGKDETAIRAVLHQWIDALKKGDMVALQQILPADYRITLSDGRILNREENLEPIAKKQFTFSSAGVDSVDVRVFGDAAVVTGVGIFTVLMGEKSMDVRERFTDTYVRRKGKWQPVASHSTPLRTPQTSGSR